MLTLGNLFVVWDFEKDGKFWAMAEKIPRSDNIVSHVKTNVSAISMQIFTSWKQAEEIANLYNETYISDGKFAF